MRIRSAGLIAGSVLIGAALLAPVAVLANTASQPMPISWDEAKPGTEDQCKDVGITEDQVYWHILQNGVAAAVESGNLTATFKDAGVVGPVASYDKNGGTLHWGIITGKDTVQALSTDVQSDGQLVVSHVCWLAPKPTPTPTATPTATPTEPVITPTPTVSFEAETGTPRVTPPPTDMPGNGTGSGSGWTIVLMALGGLAAVALVVTPARRRNR